MSWTVLLDDEFAAELQVVTPAVRIEILAHARLLEEFGPSLGRPHIDTLKDSRHPNMKELRLNADRGVWRVAFAFDPIRQAILLAAGNKVGQNKKRFYKRLIATADKRFDVHLAQLKQGRQS